MPKALELGSAVRVADGETIDNDQTVDVGGMSGRVCDGEGYENTETGARMIGVQLDDEHGGGHLMVPDTRLQSSGGARTFGGLGAAYDRIFGRKRR